MWWDWEEDLSPVTEVCYIKSGCSSVGEAAGGSGNFVVGRKVGGDFKTFNLLYALTGGDGGVTAASDRKVFILWTLQRRIREWR